MLRFFVKVLYSVRCFGVAFVCVIAGVGFCCICVYCLSLCNVYIYFKIVNMELFLSLLCGFVYCLIL